MLWLEGRGKLSVHNGNPEGGFSVWWGTHLNKKNKGWRNLLKLERVEGNLGDHVKG